MKHERTARQAGAGFGKSGAPDAISVMALASLYNSEPRPAVKREELLEHARVLLAKYDLEAHELNEAAPILAQTLCMLIEQNGGRDLDEQLKRKVERNVLEWCGCVRNEPRD